MWKRVCGICKKELLTGEECNCSEKVQIVFSANNNNFTAYEDRVKCECGSDKFTLQSHINYGDSHAYIFQCSICNRTIRKDSSKKNGK